VPARRPGGAFAPVAAGTHRFVVGDLQRGERVLQSAISANEPHFA
jgi:hypothetical protein